MNVILASATDTRDATARMKAAALYAARQDYAAAVDALRQARAVVDWRPHVRERAIRAAELEIVRASQVLDGIQGRVG